MNIFLSGLLMPVIALFSCAQNDNSAAGKTDLGINGKVVSAVGATENYSRIKTDTATFGTGCFWCTEAIFQQLNGVLKVTSGYTGGKVKNPSYEAVCTGTTGHAEVIQMVYDPAKISFDELLEVFWQTHDPTTLNRQGNDVGTQYRSAVFYHNAEQKEKAEKYKAELDKSGAFDNKIVTEITKSSAFYAAENYHQNYYN
ncbi:MAG: peptide-methionine (S)-S-oxide reductase, partial [Chitinophagaceae bacterium]